MSTKTRWTLVGELPSKHRQVHIAHLTNESLLIPLSKKDKYVLKVLTSSYLDDDSDKILYDTETHIDTIKLNIKLGLLGLMPGILDYSTFASDEQYFVTKLYMMNGTEYIRFLNDLYDKRRNNIAYNSRNVRRIQDPNIGIDDERLDTLYRGYMTRLIVLYNQLASLGICSFDTKNENIVLNYNSKYEITDMRLIDIEYDQLMQNPINKKNQTESNIRVYCTAMLIMNFAVASLKTYCNIDRLMKYYRTSFNTPITGIHIMSIDEIQSSEGLIKLSKLISDTHIITWGSMLWCYWNRHGDTDTFTDCTVAEQEFMIERTLSAIFEPLVSSRRADPSGKKVSR